MLNNILIIISLFFTSLLSYFSYKYGKNKKENEMLKYNEELKRIFKDNTINSNDDLFNKLSKGNF